MVNDSKEVALSRHTGADSHPNSQMLKQHTHYTFTSSNQISSRHREQVDTSPAPNQAVLCNWYLLGEEKSVFSDGITGYIKYTPEQVTCPGVADLHKLYSMFSSVCVYFCFGVFFVWTFAFILFFFLKERKRTWEVERWAGFERKRKGYDKKKCKILRKICKEGKVVSVRAGGEEVPLSTDMQIMQISTLLSNIYDF